MRRRHQLLAYTPVDPPAQQIGVAVVPGVFLLMPAIISGPHAIRHRFSGGLEPYLCAYPLRNSCKMRYYIRYITRAK
jgi:hypothetical protein